MAHEYTDEQIELLIDLAPELMMALNQIAVTPAVPFSTDRLTHANRTIMAMRELAKGVFYKLDRYCWHTPACGPGELCYGGEPGAAERLVAQKKQEADDEARREDLTEKIP